jgi:hypothetical protein
MFGGERDALPLGGVRAPRRDRTYLLAVLGLIGLGWALRVWQWSANRSLWFDESTVALGLLSHPLGEQLGQHDFGQVSPPGWIGLVTAGIAVLGPAEWAMRLPTLIQALLYLPALWLLLERLVSPRAALLGLALTAMSPALIKWSAELKPYGADPLISVVALWAVIAAAERPTLSLRAGAAIGLALGALTWFSAAAIIVIVGSIPALIAAGRRSSDRARWTGLAVAVAIALAVFALAYGLHYRPELWLGQYLHRAWAFRFWSGGPELLDRIWRSMMEVVRPLFFGHGGDLFPGLILLLLVIGARRVVRREGWFGGAPAVGPVLGLMLLAVLRVYPVHTRLALFLAPCLTILLVSGWEQVGEWAARRWPTGPRARWALVLTAVWLLFPLPGTAVRVNREVLMGPHARPIVMEGLARRRPDEAVYVFARASPEWLFYTTDWAQPDLARIHLVRREYRYPDGRTFENAPPRGGSPITSGSDLRYDAGGRLELYGQFSGFEKRTGWLKGRRVDPGWAAVEVDRMVAGDPGCVWLIEMHAPLEEREEVKQALSTKGYGVRAELASGESRIEKVCRGSQVNPGGG